MNKVFLKRIMLHKTYWLAVIIALLLLMCSIVYTNKLNGEAYTFFALFYHENAKEALQYGEISIKEILIGYDTGYLWMFCPIIVGIPCIITQKVERFVLFRTSKNRYFFSKYSSNLCLSGMILVFAYLLFAGIGMWITEEVIWDLYFVKKLVSVFCWGMLHSVFTIFLSEIIRNKYLILCIPFVCNYFFSHFLMEHIPYEIMGYITFDGYQRLFLQDKENFLYRICILSGLIVVNGIFIKIIMERRCDCGQR